MLYKIDLVEHNIVSGRLTKDGGGHYSAAQYLQAYNNVVGIQAALNYADSNNYRGVYLPKGDYSVCYATEYPALFYPKSFQTVDLGGSIIRAIYDSTQKSPYHTVEAEEAWKLKGRFFRTEGVQNVRITNGELIGDVYERSFTDPGSADTSYGSNVYDNEIGRQDTFGVHVYASSYNITIDNLNIHGFMGDGIGMSTRPFITAPYTYFLALNNRKFLKGKISRINGAIQAKEGYYYSEQTFEIDRARLREACPLFPNILQLQTGGGFTRIPKSDTPFFEVAYYDSENKFIIKVLAKYLDKLDLPPNATKLKIALMGEKSTAPDITVHQQFVAFTQAASSNILVSMCQIHDNHRGGLSNLADETTVEKCNIFNNGGDSGIGVKRFPDTTRFAINCEDSVASSVVIRDCDISTSFHGIIVGCYRMTIENCTLSNFGASAIYIINCMTTIIKGNNFINAYSIGNNGSPSNEVSHILFENNIVKSAHRFVIKPHPTTHIMRVINNVFDVTLIEINIKHPESVVSHNYFNYGDIKYTLAVNNIYAPTFTDNLVSKMSDGIRHMYYAVGKSERNVYKNINIETKGLVPVNNEVTVYHKGDTFTDCVYVKSMVRADNINNYKATFLDCEFTNTKNEFFDMPGAIATFAGVSDMYFRNCVFNIVQQLPLVAKASASPLMKWNLDVLDSDVNYKGTGTPKFLTAPSTGTTKVRISNTKISGTEDFDNLVK